MKRIGSTFAASWKTGLHKTSRNLMAITRRDAALQDLIGLAYHIALDNVEAAYRFLDAAEETFRDLEGGLPPHSRCALNADETSALPAPRVLINTSAFCYPPTHEF